MVSWVRRHALHLVDALCITLWSSAGKNDDWMVFFFSRASSLWEYYKNLSFNVPHNILARIYIYRMWRPRSTLVIFTAIFTKQCVELRTAIFWAITQRVMVIPYRRFGQPIGPRTLDPVSCCTVLQNTHTHTQLSYVIGRRSKKTGVRMRVTYRSATLLLVGSVFRVDVIQKHAMLQWYAHFEGRLTDLHFCPHLQHTQAYQSSYTARRNSDINLLVHHSTWRTEGTIVLIQTALWWLFYFILLMSSSPRSSSYDSS